MKALLTSLPLLLISTLLLQAQPLEWQKGAVVLANDQVATGLIYHPQGFDIILFKDADERIVLTPAVVKLFLYYDSAAGINRKFITLKGKLDLEFYEVVIDGEAKVVRRMSRYANKTNPDEIESYCYFSCVNGSLDPINLFRHRVYPRLLEERKDEIESYMKRERLNPNEMKSALLIIKEFNRIEYSELQAKAN